MNIVTAGAGQPVILASGLGGACFDWVRCADPLAAAGFRVIAFDRPGLGGSPVTTMRPTLDEAVRDTAAVAGWAGDRPILVAHSMAAFAAEALARLRPGLLPGLVLVDPSWERDTRLRLRVTGPLTPVSRVAGAVLDVTGLARVLGPALHRLVVPRPDVATSPQIRQVYGRGQVLARIALENLAYPEQAADLQALRTRHPFPWLPLTVITALGGIGRPAARDRWIRDHAELAAFSPDHEHIVLDDSSHQVQADRPDVIVEAVKALR